MVSSSSVLLFCTAAVTGMYAFSYPLYGTAYDIDSASNYRIGLPLQPDDACNVSSEANMSLRLAWVSGIVSLVITILIVIYNITPKKSTNWPVQIIWMTSVLSFLCQLLVFSIITARISTWFLSCTNPSKIEGACPTTRYKELKSDITDIEQCNFHPITLTLFNSENDLFLDCLNEQSFSNYNREFARYDVPAYYTAAALCLRNETATLGADLSWCYFWGCSTCTPETYYMNAKWFGLDIALLILIVANYIVIMGEFYVIQDVKVN